MGSKKKHRQEWTVDDGELLEVMADFLEMGHVENIVAMFKQESRYYDWTGDLLTDERFTVRLGVAVLFEYLVEERPDAIELAIPSLVRQMDNPNNWVRGEVANVLGIINTPTALDHVLKMVDDPDRTVAAVARDIVMEAGWI